MRQPELMIKTLYDLLRKAIERTLSQYKKRQKSQLLQIYLSFQISNNFTFL